MPKAMTDTTSVNSVGQGVSANELLAAALKKKAYGTITALIFDNLHSSGFSYLLNINSIFSCLFRLLILFASATSSFKN
jgi:hypothetical protein